MLIKRKDEMVLLFKLILSYFFIQMDSIQSGNELKQIFNSFDLDKSGSIDLNEIGKVAQKLGKPLAQQELTKIIKQLDTNKDGKISFGELQYWWKKGMIGQMAQLVYLKAKAMKMTGFIKKKFQDANISFDGHKGNSKPDKYDFKIKFGVPNQNSIKVNFGFFIKGQKQADLTQKLKKLIPNFSNNMIGFVFKFPCTKPAEAKVVLDQVFNDIMRNSKLPIRIENISQNPFLRVKTIVAEKQLIVKIQLKQELQEALTPVSSSAQHILNQIGDGFYSLIQLSLTINSSFDEIIDNLVAQSIMKGFQASLYIQANNSALKKLRQFGQKQNNKLPSYFNLISLFRCAKLYFKLKNPDHLQSFFKNLGIDEAIKSLPKINQFLQFMGPQLKQAAQQQFTVQIFYKISKFLFTYVQKDIQIFLLVGQLGAGSLRMQGKGASKIHALLFNQ